MQFPCSKATNRSDYLRKVHATELCEVPEGITNQLLMLYSCNGCQARRQCLLQALIGTGEVAQLCSSSFAVV